ncbi:Outer membrane porin protein [Burkholderia multivorans]|nr:Outer membrane porin protein [Burkholderia multivorans]MDR8924678.1 Outer membrane porin protein [Burkholderia multivorans]MDR8967501.1 Outer membrane porin protein [Burkholderia multivorans]MDR8991951.1 Outer membrane porin protein [Burkholderia multivorans]MDR9019320.1 Outer membrane porin protein [Burkholderia multivorans]
MVKHAVAAAVVGMGAVSGAWAQSSVVLYGSLDAGVAYVNNVGGHAKWAMIQGNTQPDRWGLKGKEDLGGGLSAIFQLENGFYTNNGQFATANTIWNRAAYVGLSSERLGTLTLGRQTPLMFDYLDPLSTAYLAMSWFAFHPGNIDGLAATGNVPYNNAIKYRSPSFAGFSAAATLALGNTTNFSTGKSVGVALNYANGPFKAAAVYSSEHDRSVLISQTGIASFQGQNTANGYLANKVENIGAGASYQFGDFLVHGLYTRTKMQSNGYSDTFQSYDAGVNYRSSPFNTIAGGADDDARRPPLDAGRTRRHLCAVETHAALCKRAVRACVGRRARRVLYGRRIEHREPADRARGDSPLVLTGRRVSRRGIRKRRERPAGRSAVLSTAAAAERAHQNIATL